MDDPDRTPRPSGTSQFWTVESEKLAVRLDCLSIELLAADREEEAGEANEHAEVLRNLAIVASQWALLERDNPRRVAEMGEVITAHRKAFEMLSRERT